MINTRSRTSISSNEALSITGYPGFRECWRDTHGMYLDEFYNTAGGSVCVMEPCLPRECLSMLEWQSSGRQRLVWSKTHIGQHPLNVGISGVTYRNMRDLRTAPCGEGHHSPEDNSNKPHAGLQAQMQTTPRKAFSPSANTYCLITVWRREAWG